MKGAEQIRREFHEIAFAITDGNTQAVKSWKCPACDHELLFSFTTRGEPNKYGLFLICSHCERQYHFSFKGRPPNFDLEKVLPQFQELEDRAVTDAREVIQRIRREDELKGNGPAD